jgi:hypothetical protein
MAALVPLLVLASTGFEVDPHRLSTEIGFNASGFEESLSAAVPLGLPASVMIGGSAWVRLYLGDGVIDDEHPLSLQPFLQRASTLTFEAGAAHRSNLVLDDVGTLSGRLNLYLTPLFALTAEANGALFSSSGIGGHELNPSGSLGAGLRLLDELRIDLAYELAPSVMGLVGQAQDTVFFHGFGTLSASLFWVLGERASIDLGGRALDRGAGLSGGVSVYFGKMIVGHAGGDYVHGAIYVDSGLVVSRFSANAELTAWFTPTLGAAIRYQPTWTTDIFVGNRGFPPPQSATQLEHFVNGSVWVRF